MNAIESFLWENDFEPLPEFVIDRNGLKVFTNTDIWRLHTAGRDQDKVNVGRIQNSILRYAFSRYMIFCIERYSPVTVISIAGTILSQLSKVEYLDKVSGITSPEVIETSLIKAVNDVLKYLRLNKKVSEFYEITRWYLWSSDYTSECGFNSDFALHLSRIKIPGGIKGEAVRSRDPEEGPLHFELEEPLVRRALLEDISKKFEHRQQRLAVALSLAFGRNSLNYARLREEDFVNLTAGFPDVEDLWQLNIPRIKKRSAPRELFRAETCDSRLAEMIRDVIEKNQKYSTALNGKDLPRPLFIRTEPKEILVGTDSEPYAFHFSSNDFLRLIRDWADRSKLISPITDQPLRLTPRRLRYTFACNMARQGASRAALAEMLDHTDTQNVGVYFELFDELVGMLDKALATKIGMVLGWFRGKIIDSDNEAINGDNPDKHLIFVGEENPSEQLDIGVCGKTTLCHLDPPYSCYLCPKFQPYRHASHERVLEILLSDREARIKKYENSKLGVQLDDVIYAVAQAAAICKESR